MAEPSHHPEQPLAHAPPPPSDKFAPVKRPVPRPPLPPESTATASDREVVEAKLLSDPSTAQPAIMPPPINPSASHPRTIARAATGIRPVWYVLTGFAVVFMLGLFFFVSRRLWLESQGSIAGSAEPAKTALNQENDTLAKPQANPSTVGATITTGSVPAALAASPAVGAAGRSAAEAEEYRVRREAATALLEKRGLKRLGRTWVLKDEAECLNLVDTGKQVEKRLNTATTTLDSANKKVESLRRNLERDEARPKRNSAARKEFESKRADRLAQRRASLKAAQEEAKAAQQEVDANSKRATDIFTEAKRLAAKIDNQYAQLAADKQLRQTLDDLGHQLGPSEEFLAVRVELSRVWRLRPHG